MVIYKHGLDANGWLQLGYKYHDDSDPDMSSLLPPQFTQDTVHRLGLGAPQKYAGSSTQGFTILSEETDAEEIV